MRKHIWLIEKNVHGAWVIYGSIGIKQYYYYTKRQAIAQYSRQCEKNIIKEIKAK